MLFFLFACIGNLTYVLSIIAYEPHCSGKHGRCAKGEAAAVYGRYILVNASWLLGSLGTLFLDFGIFCQFFIYRDADFPSSDEEEEAVGNGGSTSTSTGQEGRLAREQRPLLSRGDSNYE